MKRSIVVSIIAITALFFTSPSFGKSRSDHKPIGSSKSGVKPLGGGKPVQSASSIKIGSINIKRDTKNYQTGIGKHTRRRGFGRLLIVVKEGGHGGVIVNSILVKVNNKYRKKNVALRTKNGDNFVSIDIPRGAQEVKMSLDSGAGSHATFYLVK